MDAVVGEAKSKEKSVPVIEAKFKDYVDRYCSVMPLTQYDRDNLLRLYFYQLGVCDYYSQYLNAEEDRKEEYLTQARFATRVLQSAEKSGMI